MMGKEHITFGLALGVAAYPVLPEALTKLPPESSAKEILLFTGIYGAGIILGSLLPDIDLEESTISRIFPFGIISFFIRKFFDHRTITHDVLWSIPLGIFLMLNYPYCIGLVLGYWGHLFLDGFTVMGITWGYLFHKKKFTPYWSNSLKKMIHKDRNKMSFKDGVIHFFPPNLKIKDNHGMVKRVIGFRAYSDTTYARLITWALSIAIFFLIGTAYHRIVPNSIYYDTFLNRRKKVEWLVNNGDEETIEAMKERGWIDENLNYIK